MGGPLIGVDEIVLSLYAKGLTTGEISAHFAEIYGASVSKETISRITDGVIDEMQGWQTCPLEGVYAAVFIDALVVKVRDGQVANSPSTPLSGSPWRVTGTSWACGPAPPAAVKGPSSGWRCSPISATGASTTCSSWSATA